MESSAFLDNIKFGNPSKEDVNNMHIANYLDNLLPELYKWQPPRNSERATREELNILATYADKIEKRGRKNIFDAELVPYMEDIFVANGANPHFVHKITQNLVDDLLPLITKLKYRFQRPRPFQLAYYYKFHLYPHFSNYVSSPSYPSGHVTLGTIICMTLGNHYPESYTKMLTMVDEIAESRLFLGVHYPSDNECAKRVARKVFEHREFKRKYEL